MKRRQVHVGGLFTDALLVRGRQVEGWEASVASMRWGFLVSLRWSERKDYEARFLFVEDEEDIAVFPLARYGMVVAQAGLRNKLRALSPRAQCMGQDIVGVYSAVVTSFMCCANSQLGS